MPKAKPSVKPAAPATKTVSVKTNARLTKDATLTPKRRADWSAIERDFRTSKFTLREIAAKYGVSHQAVSKRAKNESWPQDLSLAIKQATNAKLVDELVAKEVAKNGQLVANTVLAAAEVNTRIIQGHRVRLADITEAVAIAKAKLMAIGESVTDIREAGAFVTAINNLASATKTLIDQERKAHNLDDEDAPDPSKEQHTVKVVFV
jgi:predicted DNA-binding protein YlxM (UPF0122 family)